ncbi:beta-lactamase/transpeptidase-like protein [Aspergillus pseudotamarii]|uniref:Beta-lactamase/transpeptidase-like protein n=1 Tax=Aspergillus pseudotamarii TaxID=132259 RepID=A0A5N6T6J7_ASPPS|nr:beta-lactamase/transpeptidase-like protein [Aspergillus pseudotamarii]KAE8141932.1 beta-lactamase/transpeptidase-like protein [Aspergillus pseudotamarii]
MELRQVLERLEEAHAQIERVREICGASSISCGVLHYGDIIYTKSVGLRDQVQHLPADSQTIYPLASVSKGFLAAAVGILVDKGKLDWHVPISTYLPQFDPVNDRDLGEYANIIDLLSHATGLAQHDLLHIGPFGSIISDSSKLVHLLNALPTSNSHGSRFRRWWLYNNHVSALASQVLESVSDGTCYPELLEQRILRPLRMFRTFVSMNKFNSDSNIALPYARLSNSSFAKLPFPEYLQEKTHILASQGVTSCVQDLLIWVKATLERESWEQLHAKEKLERPVPPNNPLRQITTIRHGHYPHPFDDAPGYPSYYCLGWLSLTLPSSNLGMISFNKETRRSGDHLDYVLGKDSPPLKVILHNGKAPGYNSAVYTFPETSSAIIVLASGATDGDPADWIDLAEKEAVLSWRWFDDYILRPLREDLQKSEGDSGASDSHLPNLRTYEGHYRNAHLLTTLNVRFNESRSDLAVSFNHRTDKEYLLRLHKEHEFSFLPLDRDSWLRDCMLEVFDYRTGILKFTRTGDGDVSGLWWKWSAWEEASLFTKQTHT